MSKPLSHPVPARLQIVTVLRNALKLWRGMNGLDAYERYVQHCVNHRCDQGMLSEAEFWQQRWHDQHHHPNSRCC